MLEAEYQRLSAGQIAAAVRGRDLSAGEEVEAALERIREVDDRVRAFREVWADRARARATAIDRDAVEHATERPSLGVPIAVKARSTAYVEPLVAAGAIQLVARHGKEGWLLEALIAAGHGTGRLRGGGSRRPGFGRPGD